MSIYRSEQVEFSMASEPGNGGYIDYISAVTDATDWTGVVNGAITPGSRSVTFDGASGTLVVGNYVMIGTGSNSEIRRISSLGSYNGTGATGTVYFDYPTGFYHEDNEIIDEKTVPDSTLAGDSFVTFLPGVYETVTTPDMQAEILPQYFLGTTSTRNPYIYLRGRQTFTGSLPNFILLNGYPMRFPIGSVRTVLSDVTADVIAINEPVTNYAYKGIRTLNVDGVGSGNTVNGEYIEIDRGGTNPEVRQIISGGGSGALVLNYPLMFSHADNAVVGRDDSSTYFTHTIVETDALDSMTWHVRMKDSGATEDDGGICWVYSAADTITNSLARRWVGGKIGRATIAADEGGMLTMSWDDVPFLDEVHNQALIAANDVPKYSASIMNPGDETTGASVGGDIPHAAGALGIAVLPVTEPYYFSEGSITFFGIELARIVNFRIEINNNLDPKYYIRDQATDRIPAEIIEQRREYRMTATVALPDSLTATATTASLFKELLFEGNYAGAGMSGFDISLVFTRGASDTITITIPPATAAVGGDAQGAYIVRAPHDIGTESPLQANVELVFRSMQIVVVDAVAVYP